MDLMYFGLGTQKVLKEKGVLTAVSEKCVCTSVTGESGESGQGWQRHSHVNVVINIFLHSSAFGASSLPTELAISNKNN